MTDPDAELDAILEQVEAVRTTSRKSESWAKTSGN
jgi:hypothetical protein